MIYYDGQIIEPQNLDSAIEFVNSREDGDWTVVEHFDDGELKYRVVNTPASVLRARARERLFSATQRILDNEARKLDYDSCLSVCSYVDSGVQKFDNEGRAFREWRSSVWKKFYEIIEACDAGDREFPTEEELIAELPALTIANSE